MHRSFQTTNYKPSEVAPESHPQPFTHLRAKGNASVTWKNPENRYVLLKVVAKRAVFCQRILAQMAPRVFIEPANSCQEGSSKMELVSWRCGFMKGRQRSVQPVATC